MSGFDKVVRYQDISSSLAFTSSTLLDSALAASGLGLESESESFDAFFLVFSFDLGVLVDKRLTRSIVFDFDMDFFLVVVVVDDEIVRGVANLLILACEIRLIFFTY